MSKLSERWFCPGDGGHWVDSGSEFLGREFCSEHDSRKGAILGRVVLGIFFMLILVWFIGDFWTYCTVTDPEYLERLLDY